MKIIYIAIFTLSAFILSGQVTYLTESISEGSHPAYSIILQDVDTKFVDNQWKTYIKKYGGKYKYNRRAKEHTNTNTSLNTVSDQVVDTYAITRSAGNNTQFVLLVKEGDSFINWARDSTKATSVSNLLDHFALEVAREALREQIDDEEKNLNQLERTQSRLERANEKLHSSIESYEEKIQQARTDIETNVQDQEANQQAMELQKQQLEALKKKLSEI